MAAHNATTLLLSGKAITSIPEEVVQKSNDVCSLDLSRNPGIQLQNTLLRLRNIRKLLLSDCALLAIPEEICQLKKLEELVIGNISPWHSHFRSSFATVQTAIIQLIDQRTYNCQAVSSGRIHRWKTSDELKEIIDSYEEYNTWRNNFSTGVNPAIGQLKQLRRLDLRLCNLRSLPDSIGDLKQLQELLLGNDEPFNETSHNDFSEGLTSAIGKLVRLKILRLENCNLTVFPDFIGNLEQLQELILGGDIRVHVEHSHDFSGGISPAIGQLVGLKILDLQLCNLQTLPDCIGNLTKLEELYIALNDFKSDITPAIERLHRLKKLNLGLCKLTALPEFLGSLKQVEDIVICDSKYPDRAGNLIATLEGLKQLKKLHLGKLELYDAPLEISHLQKLEELCLRGTDLKDGLSPAIGKLCRLKRLNLTNCRLETLPDNFNDLQQLEELLLGQNEFSDGLPPSIGQLTRLRKLNLESCSMKVLPETIGNLQQLEELFLGTNDFSDVLTPALGKLIQLKKLDLEDCHLTGLPEFITNLKQLEQLYLQDNDFSNGLTPAIGTMKRLQILNLRSCQLQALPDSLGDLEELFLLKLKHNELDEYPRCTLRLKNLCLLDLSNRYTWKEWKNNYGNRIKELPLELAYTNIRILKINKNPIEEPPSEIWTQGIEAIKSFMRDIIPGGALITADTINILGDALAGKTSVAQSLIARSPCPTKKSDRTHVLQQLRWKIDSNSELFVKINDFGGHQIYHTILPIFFPANGLVILVFNLMDKKWRETVRKWLLTAIAKSKEVRVIIVGTHADQLQSSMHRSALESDIASLSLDILRKAIEEVNAHINHLHSKRDGCHEKIENLCRLLASLQRCKIPIVTLSCSQVDKGLTDLHDLVVNSLRPPATLPVFWCRVIKDMFSYDCLYISMEQVNAICRAHIAEEDGSLPSITILRYLAKTSQIVWLEEHPVLRQYIFHSPQKIIDICKQILFGDIKALSHLKDLYKSELDLYRKGILPEPLMLELLSTHQGMLTTTDGTVLSQKSQTVAPVDVVINFIEQFNIIGCVNKERAGKQFIIPSKLKSTAPPTFNKYEKIGAKCLNRVIVRLSFMGSIIPMSLFETSLSLMLSTLGKLAKHHAQPMVWSDGLLTQNDGIYFIAARRDNVLTLSAFSETGSPSPWKILHPVIKSLNDNVNGSWNGAPPHCAVVCPCCSRSNQSGSRLVSVGQVSADLSTLAAVYEEGSQSRPSCDTCKKIIPQSLYLPTIKDGSFTSDLRKIHELFKNCDFIDRTISLQVNLLRIIPDLERALLLEHVQDLALYIYSKGCINDADWQNLRRQTSDREARIALISLVEAAGDNAIRCLAEALHRIEKHDLARKLCPKSFFHRNTASAHPRVSEDVELQILRAADQLNINLHQEETVEESTGEERINYCCCLFKSR